MEEPETQTRVDAPPRRTRAPNVTYAVIGVAVVVFLLRLLEEDPWSDEALGKWGVFDAWEIYGGELHALLTSVFVHVDLIHVGFNLCWLWVLGRAAERAVGSLRYLLFFVAAAWVSSACELAATGDTGVGLSGVVYALFGLLWLARPARPAFAQVVDNRVVRFMIGWLFLCVVLTWVDVWNVGNFAHFSGLAFGTLVGAAMVPGRRRAPIAGTALLVVASTVSLFWAPWSASWQGIRAFSHYDAGDYRVAIVGFDRAIDLDPEYASAYEYRGWSRIELDEYKAAIADFTKAIEVDGSSPGAYGGRGQAYRLSGDYGNAIADLDKAIALDEDDAFAYFERGWAWFDMGDDARALEDFVRSTVADDTHPSSFHAAAWTLATTPVQDLQDPDRAVSLARKAVELLPENAVFRTTLGAALYRAGRWKESLEALLAGEKNAYGWFFVAMAYEQRGDAAVAKEWYRQAVAHMEEHYPGSKMALRLRAEAQETLGIEGE